MYSSDGKSSEKGSDQNSALKLNVVRSWLQKHLLMGSLPTAMDTGASTHTCGNPDILDSDTRYKSNVKLKMAYGALVDASVRGDVLINSD